MQFAGDAPAESVERAAPLESNCAKSHYAADSFCSCTLNQATLWNKRERNMQRVGGRAPHRSV